MSFLLLSISYDQHLGGTLGTLTHPLVEIGIEHVLYSPLSVTRNYNNIFGVVSLKI